MSIAATDLLAYAAASQPEDESSSAGGAIELTTKVVFTDLSAADKVDAVSSAAGDTTQKVTVRGRLASGVIASQQVTLNGTSVVALSTYTFERILDVTLDGTCTGTITITKHTGGATLVTIEPGFLKATRLFNLSYSAVGAKTYYAKLFLKNTHGTLALLGATVKENADPAALITFAVEDAVNDVHTIANRLTAPTNITTAFNGSDKTVPGTDLASGAAIGVWLKLSLAGGNAAVKNTYTIELDGNTV